MNFKKDFKELKNEIVTELLGYRPITGADEFYLNYLLSYSKVLKEEDIEDFYKDLQSASKYPYISYNFEVFLKRLAKRLANFIEQYKKTS